MSAKVSVNIGPNPLDATKGQNRPGRGLSNREHLSERADLLFAYPRKRYDGERPLAIVAAFVSLLTLYMAVSSLRHTADWRPVAFYALFCTLTLAAAVMLTLQWRNDFLRGFNHELVHTDWLERERTYTWYEVTSAVEKIRPDTRRLSLEMESGQVFVVHSGVVGYDQIVIACGQCLDRVGRSVVVD